MMRKSAKKLILVIPGGLGVTNVSLLATTIKRCESDIVIECKGRKCSGTDIAELLSMNIEAGDLVNVTADGHDAEESIRRIDVLFREDFQHVFNHVYARTFHKAIA